LCVLENVKAAGSRDTYIFITGFNSTMPKSNTRLV
jgi:hypothetical protein